MLLLCIGYMQFPYYEFVDRDSMYKVGSLFYAIYFIVSFPMFLRSVLTSSCLTHSVFGVVAYGILDHKKWKYANIVLNY
jgi:hypothetical protein